MSSNPYFLGLNLIVIIYWWWLWWGVVDWYLFPQSQAKNQVLCIHVLCMRMWQLNLSVSKPFSDKKSSDITYSCLFMTKILIWTWSSLWTCAIFNSPFLLHLHVLLLSLKLFYKQLKLQRLIPPQENRAEAKNKWFFGLPRLAKLSGFSNTRKNIKLWKTFLVLNYHCNYYIIISLKKTPVV